MTTSSLMIFGFFNFLQQYLETENFSFSGYLLNSQFTLNNITYNKCYYYDNNLELDATILKRVAKHPSNYFTILYRRSLLSLTNYRKFDIRAYSRDYIEQLVASGLLPQDYPGEYREVTLTLELKPDSNILEYQFEFNEAFVIDWLGDGVIDVEIPLNDEITFSTKLAYKADLMENLEKPFNRNRFYQSTFQVELTFPLIKLNPKSNLIQTINKAIYTY